MHAKFCNGSKMNIELTSVKVRSIPKKLKANWIIDIEQDWSNINNNIWMPRVLPGIEDVKRVFKMCRGLI